MRSAGERERWARVQELFLEALELPEDDRRTFLEEARRSEPDLVEEVVSLLAAHEEGPLAEAPVGRRPSPRHPERIRNYRIVRPLGEGGMGTVLLAVREAQGFTQTVALKVLHAGFTHRDLEARLEAERRILARLEHPGIARLIDGGVTEDGQPFFAMEYVKGEDLPSWCDARRLDVRSRVRLFLDVCEAVQHAHQQLVIHRDLKPSNILVTPAGRAKLLDFGVAKVLDEDAGEAVRTRTGAWVTPSYASPEQLRGDPVSTLSDVYALGVLLYELLTGVRPYRTAGRTPLQLERALAAGRPPSASRAPVDAGGESAGAGAPFGRPDAATRAALRGTTPERLRRQLAGDLDVIVARAMAYDPERRYGSVAALSEDLSRYLEGWPVHARPEGLAYRASKFVRRHRVAVAGVALGVGALLVGAVTTAWQARRARTEAVRAEAEADRARQVTALVTDLFRLSDPTRTLGDTVTVRQLLDEGTARIEDELAGQPTLQATLLEEVGRVYRNLGLLARAEELARRVVALREELEPGSQAHAAALGTLGEVVSERGRPEEAAELLQAALALPALSAARPDTLRARIQASLAWALRDLGRQDEAAELFREALETDRAAIGDQAPGTARTLMGLASALHDGGRFDEAEALFEEVLEGNPSPERPDPAVAAALANLGMLRRLRQDYMGAEAMLRTALDLRRALFGLDHPSTLESMDSWGAELIELGRPREARDVLAEAHERARAALGPEHAEAVSLGEALAWALEDLGEYGRAEELRDSAIATKRRVRGGDHPGIVYSLIRQGRGLREAGRVARAAEALDSARAMGDRLSEEDGVYTALRLQEEAHLAAATDDAERADEGFAAAERLLAARLRPDHRYVLSATRDRALFRLRSGADPDSVAAVLAEVDRAQRRYRPSPHIELARTALALGEAHLAAGDPGAADRAFETAASELSRTPPSHWLHGAARVGRGLASGRADWVRGGLDLVEAHLGAEAPESRRLRLLAAPPPAVSGRPGPQRQAEAAISRTRGLASRRAGRPPRPRSSHAWRSASGSAFSTSSFSNHPRRARSTP